jgi:hypothetical protein
MHSLQHKYEYQNADHKNFWIAKGNLFNFLFIAKNLLYKQKLEILCQLSNSYSRDTHTTHYIRIESEKVSPKNKDKKTTTTDDRILCKLDM